MEDVEQFARWFLDSTPVIGAVPFHGAVTMIEDVTAILLYRRDQFQVQLFAVPEGVIIPEHRHPHVDTVQVYVGGNIMFTLNGRHNYPQDELHMLDGPLACASKRGVAMRVRPDQVHGAIVGAGGGVFMAIQHWQGGIKPHCVGADYEGVAMGEKHRAAVVFGKATTKPALAAHDAASLEV